LSLEDTDLTSRMIVSLTGSSSVEYGFDRKLSSLLAMFTSCISSAWSDDNGPALGFDQDGRDDDDAIEEDSFIVLILLFDRRRQKVVVGRVFLLVSCVCVCLLC